MKTANFPARRLARQIRAGGGAPTDSRYDGEMRDARRRHSKIRRSAQREAKVRKGAR